MALNLIDIKDILKTFEHHAHAQMFLTEVKRAVIAKTVKAIPGKPQTLKVGGIPLSYQSMVILNTPEFQMWLDGTRDTITETRYDSNKVATIRNYENIDESLFELFAGQAAEDLRLAEEQDKSQTTKPAKASAPSTEDNTDTGTKDEQTDTDQAV